MESDGIVRIRMLPGDTSQATATEVINAVRDVSGGKRVPVLADIREMKKLSREARKYFGGPKVAIVQSATALLIDSGVSAVIGNFSLQVDRQTLPTRLFTSEAKALAWLEAFV